VRYARKLKKLLPKPESQERRQPALVSLWFLFFFYSTLLNKGPSSPLEPVGDAPLQALPPLLAGRA
jgi:hypothetical protein